MAQSVLFDTLPYTSRKHIFRNREETANSNVLVFKNSRIGIGTQEPEENYRVTITGNTVVRGTLTADILSFTASNQNHITIDNLGTREGLNIIQRGFDPFITFRSNESEIVSIIDGNGNLGIGTNNAYQPLVVNGKMVVEDILLTGESIYQTRFQLPPIRETFIVRERADIDFMVSMNGLYAASNDDVEVYLNGYKLAYYNSNQLDYSVSFSNEYEPPKSYFNITLTSVARAGDVVDITIWPTTLDNVQEGGTLGGYSTQSIYSYWNRALDKTVYYRSGNIGVGTDKALYTMDVRGVSYADRFKGDGSLLSNVPGFTIREDRSMFYLNGNIGIGTTYAREKLHVQGSVYIDKTLYTSNLVVLINSNVTTNFIYDFVNINTSNYGSGINITNIGSDLALYVSQQNNVNVAAFYYETSNVALYIGSNGNIGIGTNQPLYNLHVVGNGYLGGSLTLNNANINIGTGTVTASSFSGTATRVSQNLIRGSYLTGDNYNGSVATTWGVDASSYAVPNNIVARDIVGNIYASNIYSHGNLGIGTTSIRKTVDIIGDMIISGNVGIGTINPVAILDISGGTLTKASVNIRTGTLLTSSNEGSIEFDGINLYHTISSTTGRSIIETPYLYIVPVTGITLNDSASALNIFNRGFNVLPHTYEFMGQCYLSRDAGTTAHTIDFILGGNATIDTNGLSYTISIWSGTSEVTPPNTMNMNTYWRTTTTSTITASSSSATEYSLIKFNGIVRFSAIGQFTPQIQYSAAPGGTTVVSKNSYIKIYPLGSRTVEYQGQWI